MLHEAGRQRRVQGRKSERAVAVDLDELAAGAEEYDRSELRIDGAAEDEFVALGADHGLDRYAFERGRARFCGDGSFNRLVRVAYLLFIF